MNKTVIIVIAVISVLVITGVIVFIVVKKRGKDGGSKDDSGNDIKGNDIKGNDLVNSVRIHNNSLQWSTDNKNWKNASAVKSVKKVVLVKKGVNMWVAAAVDNSLNTVILNSTDGKMWNIAYNTEIQLGKLRLKYNNGWSLEGENKTVLNKYRLLKETADANYTAAVDKYAADVVKASRDISTLHDNIDDVLEICYRHFIISILEKILKGLYNNQEFNINEFHRVINIFKSILESFSFSNTIITKAIQNVFKALDTATNTTDVNNAMQRITTIKENSSNTITGVTQNSSNTITGVTQNTNLISTLNDIITTSFNDITSAIYGNIGIWSNITNDMMTEYNIVDADTIRKTITHWNEFKRRFFNDLEKSVSIKTSLSNNITEINNVYQDVLSDSINNRDVTLSNYDRIIELGTSCKTLDCWDNIQTMWFQISNNINRKSNDNGLYFTIAAANAANTAALAAVASITVKNTLSFKTTQENPHNYLLSNPKIYILTSKDGIKWGIIN